MAQFDIKKIAVVAVVAVAGVYAASVTGLLPFGAAAPEAEAPVVAGIRGSGNSAVAATMVPGEAAATAAGSTEALDRVTAACQPAVDQANADAIALRDRFAGGQGVDLQDAAVQASLDALRGGNAEAQACARALEAPVAPTP